MDWQTFETVLQHYELTFLPDKDPAVEHLRFPSMVGIYRTLHDPMDRPPSQLEFGRAVVAAPEVAAVPSMPVLARAYRTWPSLVRQEHFGLVLAARFPLVIESDQLDLRGLDFLVVTDGLTFGVGLSINTARAHAWHVVKDGRHQPLPVPVLDLYAEPDRYRVGRLWLHDPAQVEEVEAFVARERARASRCDAPCCLPHAATRPGGMLP